MTSSKNMFEDSFVVNLDCTCWLTRECNRSFFKIVRAVRTWSYHFSAQFEKPANVLIIDNKVKTCRSWKRHCVPRKPHSKVGFLLLMDPHFVIYLLLRFPYASFAAEENTVQTPLTSLALRKATWQLVRPAKAEMQPQKWHLCRAMPPFYIAGGDPTTSNCLKFRMQ